MARTFADLDATWGDDARLAWDTIAYKTTRGIPTKAINLMDAPLLEEIAGYAAGEYAKEPEKVYRDFQIQSGVCSVDQWIPRNPLTMTGKGYSASKMRGATTGAESITLDGMAIDSPEAVVEHMERFVFPALERQITETDIADTAIPARLVQQEMQVQEFLGLNFLKIPYGQGFLSLPTLRYTAYGYENYLIAYSFYPEAMERDFSLQADLAEKRNALGVRAILEGGLPRVARSYHDMADSRGTLVDIRSLDRLWFPHFARAIKPLVDAGIRLVWHSDGNLMEMVPRLIEAGFSGFQGFQYEDGMDYEKICRMPDRNGEPLMIWAGVSVTTTLPFGKPKNVVEELDWLVKHGPPLGLFLGTSSSVTPGTNPENVKTLIEGLQYYRKNGRRG